MNKQLINKYKPEFDHWLNEGKLLCYTEVDGPYYEVTDEKWDFVCDIGFIINDEYVELRKALTEGKIIQIYDVIEQHISNPSLDKFGWKDFKSFTASSPFSKTPDFYRIKPDEPKFKVGDFVRVTPKSNRAITNSGTTEFTGIIRVIDKYNLCNIKGIDNTDWFESDDIQLWTPVKDEWCWFWDKCTPHRPTLRQYDIFPEEYGEENMFHDSEQNPFDFCEPFLNSRPSYLKDK